MLVDGEEWFVSSKPLQLLEAVSLEVEDEEAEEEEEGTDKGLGVKEKGKGEDGVDGVGGLERESPKWVLALRIKEWIRASGPKAKCIISFSPWF